MPEHDVVAVLGAHQFGFAGRCVDRHGLPCADRWTPNRRRAADAGEQHREHQADALDRAGLLGGIEVERLTERLGEAMRAGLTWKRHAEDAREATDRVRELADRWDAAAASPHAPLALSAGVLRRALGDPDDLDELDELDGDGDELGPPDDPPPAHCEPRDEPPLDCQVLCCPAARPHDVGAPGCVTQP